MLNNTFKNFQVNLYKLIANKKTHWAKSSTCKVLLITGNSRIERSQIFPLYYYLKEFRSSFNCDFRELDISKIKTNSRATYRDADVIWFQPWFKMGAKNIIELLLNLKKSHPRARIVFVDSFAPVDLRFAESVEPYIDLYLKKNVFLNKQEYGKATQGDTNLMQYYEQLYNLPASNKKIFPVSKNFLSKLVVAPSFFTSEDMLYKFNNFLTPQHGKKDIRIHARIMCKGTPWYQHMRESALNACGSFKNGSVITDNLVSYKKYINELKRSKICFSPFGYGEVCWRDYEAVLSGALLIKQDMSHIETYPNIFIPYKTYIPVKWDFSDLKEKLDYYLFNEKEAHEIATNAYNLLYGYCQNDGFIKQMTKIFLKHE